MKILPEILIITTFLFIAVKGVSQSNEKDTICSSRQTFSASFFRDWYLNNNYDHFAENYLENSVYQIETVGDISHPDPYVYSLSGNSWQWNTYYFNSIRINDVFNPGSPIFRQNLYQAAIDINPMISEISFIEDRDTIQTFSFLYNNGGNLGGTTPFTAYMVHLFHRTAREALYKDVPEKRRVRNFISANFNTFQENSPLERIYGSFYSGTRSFNNQDFLGFNGTFDENYSGLDAGIKFRSKTLGKSSGIILSASSRDHLYAERNYEENETADSKVFSFMVYHNKKKGPKEFNHGILLNYNSRKHSVASFYRNFIDQDGQGFEPWFPDGQQMAVSHNATGIIHLSESLSIKTDHSNSVLFFNPVFQNYDSYSYAESHNRGYTSLYMYQWNSAPEISGLLDNSVLLQYSKRINNKHSIEMNIGGGIDGFILSKKSTVTPSLIGSVNAFMNFSKYLFVHPSAGRQNIPYTVFHTRFYSNAYQNAAIYYWNDANQDHAFQEYEKGGLYSTSGGIYQNRPENIGQPAYYYLEIPIDIRFLKGNTITLSGQYKQFVNTWDIAYSESLDQAGYFTEIDEQEIYFLNNGVRYYETSNLESSRISKALGRSNFLINNPFYESFLVKYTKECKKLIFSASWTSFKIIGRSAYGNGFLHNDLAILSESLANPNTNRNDVGRIDSDRGYMGKLFISWRTTKKIHTVFQFLYKDGQPFSVFDYAIDSENGQNQWASWAIKVRGSNDYALENGYRNDAFFNSCLSIKYNGSFNNKALHILVSVYNLIDFETGLSEYSFIMTKRKERFNLELNSPRGFFITLQYQI